jgi:hypothetical protein
MARRRGRKSRGAQHAPSRFFPTPIDQNLPIRRVWQFVASAATNGPIYFDNINAFGMAVSSTVAYGLYDAVRLRRVKVWGVNSSSAQTSTSMCTVSVEWSGAYGPGTKITGIGNADRPAFIDCRPPPLSDADRWQQLSGSQHNVAFYLNVPAGAVVEVDAELTQIIDAASNPVTYAYSGGMTTGEIYSLFLDAYSTNGKLAPQLPAALQGLA